MRIWTWAALGCGAVGASAAGGASRSAAPAPPPPPLVESIGRVPAEIRDRIVSGLAHRVGEARTSADLVGATVTTEQGPRRVIDVSPAAAPVSRSLPDMTLLAPDGEMSVWRASRHPWSPGGKRRYDLVEASFVVAIRGELLIRFADLKSPDGKRATLGRRGTSVAALVHDLGCVLYLGPGGPGCRKYPPCTASCALEPLEDDWYCRCTR